MGEVALDKRVIKPTQCDGGQVECWSSIALPWLCGQAGGVRVQPDGVRGQSGGVRCSVATITLKVFAIQSGVQ